MAYFNKKAQSLTELATFGSVLLLVLSFFISYGMRYNYQQEIQMRAFRTALAQAYTNTNRPDASASVVLVDDRHIPDPRDMFGAGSIVPVEGGAEVTWGNTMQDGYLNVTNPPLLPTIKYVFNDRNPANRAEREYKTAGYNYIDNAYPFYVILPGNTAPQLITWVNVRNYQPTPDSPQQAMVLLPNQDKEVITELYLKTAGPTPGYIKFQIIGVRTNPPNGGDGTPIDQIYLLSPSSGEINPNYMQLNNDVDMNGTPDVTPANIQGLLLEDKQDIRRSGTITIQETPGKTISTSTYSFKDKAGNPTTITHKIRSSSGVEEINFPFERGGVPSTWTTQK
ncbi:MAG: hypothetical protein PHG87_07225 [Candidatus Omnitrophica bacterium]|nr:hypothetical protein [Candidatus Omnitrophota bacterium]